MSLLSPVPSSPALCWHWDGPHNSQGPVRNEIRAPLFIDHEELQYGNGRALSYVRPFLPGHMPMKPTLPDPQEVLNKPLLEKTSRWTNAGGGGFHSTLLTGGQRHSPGPGARDLFHLAAWGLCNKARMPLEWLGPAILCFSSPYLASALPTSTHVAPHAAILSKGPQRGLHGRTTSPSENSEDQVPFDQPCSFLPSQSEA